MMSINLQVMNMGPSKALDAKVEIATPLMLLPHKFQLIRIAELQVGEHVSLLILT